MSVLRRNVLLAALAAGLISSAAHADTFVVGDNPTSQNCAPFGCARNFATNSRYQQVYDASQFGRQMSISGLTFYNHVAPGGALNPGVFTISLSTTDAQVDALDIFDFDANVGADSSLLFQGVLPGLTADGELILNFAGSFAYDPSAGNLLVDITYDGTPNPVEAYLDAFTDDAGGMFSRAHDFGTGYEGMGLKTGFIASAAPEPGTWALMIVGFGGVGAAMRRRRALVYA